MATDETPREASLEAYFLGRIDLERCLRLEQRLAEEAALAWDGRVSVLFCEHSPIITVGRGGSAADLPLGAGALRSRQVEVRWIKRGGGTLVHLPGQLAVYPIVPLGPLGFSLAEYLRRLERGLLRTLAGLNIRGRTRPGGGGIWGRTGQLAAFGVAVRDGVAMHGAFLNVCPAMGWFRLVETDPRQATRMSSLLAERGQPVRMTSVRAELVPRLAEAFSLARYHLHTGHPWLRRSGQAAPG